MVETNACSQSNDVPLNLHFFAVYSRDHRNLVLGKYLSPVI